MDQILIQILSQIQDPELNSRLNKKSCINFIATNEDSDFFILTRKNVLRYANLKDLARQPSCSVEDVLRPIPFDEGASIPEKMEVHHLSLSGKVGLGGTRSLQLAIWGPTDVFVAVMMSKREPTGIALDMSEGNVPRLRKVLDEWLVTGVTVQAVRWHPLSQDTLVVLTSDGKLHLAELGHTNPFCSEVISQRFDTGLLTPVDFCFGASASWQRFTIYTLDVTGKITCLCPIVPPDIYLKKKIVMDLWEEVLDTSEFPDRWREVFDWISYVFGSQSEENEWDGTNQEEDDDDKDEGRTEMRGMLENRLGGHSTTVLQSQGVGRWIPCPQVVGIRNDDSTPVTCSAIACLTAADPFHGTAAARVDILCRAHQSDKIDVLMVDHLEPSWAIYVESEDPSVMASLMEVAEVGHGQGGKPHLLLDPKQPALCYLADHAGVAMLSFPWVQELTTVMLNGLPSRQDTDTEGAASVQPRSKLVTEMNCMQAGLLFRVPSATSAKMEGLVGMSIVSEPLFGHLLLLKLPGKPPCKVINITEQRWFHQLDLEGSSEGNSRTPGSRDLGVAPFQKHIQKLMQEIKTGVVNLPVCVSDPSIGRLRLEEANEKAVQQLLDYRIYAEKHVIHHMLALNDKSARRVITLRELQEHQQEKLETLQQNISLIQKKNKETKSRAQTIQECSKELADRASSILSALSQLQPSLTRAERDYYQDLSKLSQRCNEWEEQINQLKTSFKNALPKSENNSSLWNGPQLTEAEAGPFFQLLRKEHELIQAETEHVSDMKRRISALK